MPSSSINILFPTLCGGSHLPCRKSFTSYDTNKLYSRESRTQRLGKAMKAHLAKI